MKPNEDRLPPELRALLDDVREPPDGDDAVARIARGERAYQAIVACLGEGDPLLAEIAERLWVEYTNIGDHQEAEAKLHLMIDVLDRPGVMSDRRLGAAFKRLATMHGRASRWDDVIAVGARALDAFARCGAAEEVLAASVRLLMGSAYMAQNDQESARPLLLDALPGLRRNPTRRSRLVNCLRMLARIAMDAEDAGDAFSYLAEAMREVPITPKDVLRYCDISIDAGRCLLDMKSLADAAQLTEATVQMLESIEATESPLYPKALDLWGESLIALDEFAEARAVYERALAACEVVHGRDSVEMAELYTHLMWAHQGLEEHEAARQAASEAVAIYECLDIDSTRDSSHVDALWHLAERCLEVQHFDEADELAERLVGLVEPVVGPSAPRMGQLSGLRGRIRFERGDYNGALPFLERALELLEGTALSKVYHLELARMAAEVRLFHLPIDETVGPALERVIGALQAATRELEDENDRIQYGLGQTPRNERS